MQYPIGTERNGVYAEPRQEGKASIVVLNGQALGVECYIEGQPIQDIRGPRSSSNVWLGVITNDGIGYYPEVNAGYFDEAQVRRCP